MIRRMTARQALLPRSVRAAARRLRRSDRCWCGPASGAASVDPRRRDLRALRAPDVGTLRDGSWMTSTETWLDDHVPAAALARAARRLVRKGLQQKVINNVYVGDPQRQAARERAAAEGPVAFAANARPRAAVRAAGSQLLTVYVPRQEEVFADRLPAAWPRTIAAVKPAVVWHFEGPGRSST